MSKQIISTPVIKDIIFSSPTGGRRPEGVEENIISGKNIFPSPEVKAKKVRKNYTIPYKLKILDLADNCLESGDIGSLLRKEGLYSSHLSKWRKQRSNGEFDMVSAKKRGIKAKDKSIIIAENNKLKRENERLRQRLDKAEIIIDFQKKTSALLKILDQQEEKQ